MWQTKKTTSSDWVTKYEITDEAQNFLSFETVIKLWQTTPAFRDFFTSELRASPYEAYFWEVKPITRSRLQDTFEFVLLASASLPGITADPSDFQEHFFGTAPVVSFPNLSGDAMLVVPAPISPEANYSHLAQFVRNAPPEQVDKFWSLTGATYEKAICDQPRWLSTAGLGVYWLHVRIDSRPKYYRHTPYKSQM